MRFKNMDRFKTGGFGNTIELSVPLPKTPSGRVYRFSPNEKAQPRLFLLGDVTSDFPLPEMPTPRMTRVPRTPGTVCPYSGTQAEDQDFTHPDDIVAVQETIAHAAFHDVADEVQSMLSGLAQSHVGGGLIKITTDFKRSSKPTPRFARTDLLRELVCDECGRDYGVFAISLFCPDCGAPNVHLNFAREVALVRQQVEIAGKLLDDQIELAYRLLGNAHEDVLTAFEATLKTVYYYRVASTNDEAFEIKSAGNAFQNIERGRKRFAEFGFDPFENLSEDALAVLSLNIQKRHVIGHNLGVADAAFVEHATDAQLGETVPLVGEDIIQFAEIGQSVVNALDSWLAKGVPPPLKNLRPQNRSLLQRPKRLLICR